MNPFRYLLDLLFPPLCAGCREVMDDANIAVCDKCKASLPITEHATHHDNKVSGLFTDIPKVIHAAAFCHFDHENAIYNIIHAIKYHNRPDAATWIGTQAARHFQEKNPQWFMGIDLIFPIPLHRKRLGKRTYNQAELIAKGISLVTGIPVDTCHLLRRVNNKTQTLLSPQQRKRNTEGIFYLSHAEELRGKHVLLVDDIITTGATMRSAVSILTPVRGLTISILTMGMAGN